jgi:hypothetical protein
VSPPSFSSWRTSRISTDVRVGPNQSPPPERSEFD